MKEDIYIKYLNSGLFSESILKNSKISEEDFLLELVNTSKFKIIKGNKDFYLIKKQSNKENDITNDNYSCDFKLIVSSDFVWAESNFRHRVTVLDNGIRLGHQCKKQGSKNVILLAKAIRLTSLQDIIRVSNTEKKNLVDATDLAMKDYIENLKKDKHLFLFIPAEFTHKNKDMSEDEKEHETFSLIYEGFKTSKLFRNSLPIDNKDIYLTFIYNDNFVILEILENNHFVIDKVDCKKIRLFTKKLDMLWF